MHWWLLIFASVNWVIIGSGIGLAYAKLFLEPILRNHPFDGSFETNFCGSWIKYEISILKRIWICRLHLGDHFVQGPISPTMFHRSSDSTENLYCCNLITGHRILTHFRTYRDSRADVPRSEVCCYHIVENGQEQIENSIEFELIWIIISEMDYESASWMSFRVIVNSRMVCLWWWIYSVFYARN